MPYNSKIYACWPRAVRWNYPHLIRCLKPQQGERILEIGCARGVMTKRIQHLAPDTCGIDINEEAIRHSVTGNLFVMNAEKLEFQDESFDKIYSLHTIEHIPNPIKALSEMARVLKPGGAIVLFYPAEPIRGVFAIPAAIALFRDPFRARDVHLHRVTPAKIETWIKDLNLEYIKSDLDLFPAPQFFTLLRKRRNIE